MKQVTQGKNQEPFDVRSADARTGLTSLWAADELHTTELLMFGASIHYRQIQGGYPSVKHTTKSGKKLVETILTNGRSNASCTTNLQYPLPKSAGGELSAERLPLVTTL